MLRLAIRGLRDSAVWTDEVDRGLHDPIAPSYTIDTLLRARAAGARRLWLILGGDQVTQLHRWRDPRRILDLAQPIVLLRPPLTAVSELRDALLAVPGPGPVDGPSPDVRARARFWTDAEVDSVCTSTLPIDPALAPVSSSEIRRTIMTRGVQAVPTGWLNPEVADFITSHGLYQP
jgi:nicotinic acid mononucleotide adenylyltransferase